MDKFIQLTAAAAPMPTANIDTDVIMPKAFPKRIDKDGVLEGLFHDVRLNPDGTENPDFVLNQTPYRQAEIIVTGPNFGCGSSREHAVWGLRKRGIRALIGSSFAGIFFDNCANNGLLCVVLPQAQVDELLRVLENSDNKTVSIDLVHQTVTTPGGKNLSFEIEPLRKDKLLNGLDAAAETLRRENEIEAFEKQYYSSFPWLAESE